MGPCLLAAALTPQPFADEQLGTGLLKGGQRLCFGECVVEALPRRVDQRLGAREQRAPGLRR